MRVKQELSVRQKALVEKLVFEGWRKARFEGGYSRTQFWRLLNDDRIQKYMDELMRKKYPWMN